MGGDHPARGMICALYVTDADLAESSIHPLFTFPQSVEAVDLSANKQNNSTKYSSDSDSHNRDIFSGSHSIKQQVDQSARPQVWGIGGLIKQAKPSLDETTLSGHKPNDDTSPVTFGGECVVNDLSTSQSSSTIASNDAESSRMEYEREIERKRLAEALFSGISVKSTSSSSGNSLLSSIRKSSGRFEQSVNVYQASNLSNPEAFVNNNQSGRHSSELSSEGFNKNAEVALLNSDLSSSKNELVLQKVSGTVGRASLEMVNLTNSQAVRQNVEAFRQTNLGIADQTDSKQAVLLRDLQAYEEADLRADGHTYLGGVKDRNFSVDEHIEADNQPDIKADIQIYTVRETDFQADQNIDKKPVEQIDNKADTHTYTTDDCFSRSRSVSVDSVDTIDSIDSLDGSAVSPVLPQRMIKSEFFPPESNNSLTQSVNNRTSNSSSRNNFN